MMYDPVGILLYNSCHIIKSLMSQIKEDFIQVTDIDSVIKWTMF
jgi:hypothetical protein